MTAAGNVVQSLLVGFVASLPLIIGAALASFVSLPQKLIAAVMAFGAGVLVAALTFPLIDEAFSIVKDMVPVIAGFILGGIS